MLRLNGFELLVDEDAEVGKRVHLISLPVSKKTVFGVEGTLMPLNPSEGWRFEFQLIQS